MAGVAVVIDAGPYDMARDPSAPQLLQDGDYTNGEQYTIRFDTVSAGTFNWTLTKTSTSEVLYSNITNFSDTLGWNVPEAGVKFYVALPPIGMRTVTTGGQNAFIPAQSNGYGIANVVGLNGTNGLNGLGNTNRDYELRFDGTGGFAVRFGSPWPCRC